ncbi:PucR family transcriptional regulator [Actinoplanes sp. NPDC049599]|uniref:PucR family transcriptional regulator n=1 Tax=Actinoplanes sp. NPDC049599 TaxID=3363903 RepID=UPI0037ACD7DD
MSQLVERLRRRSEANAREVAGERVDDRLAPRLGATAAPRHLVCVLRFAAEPGASREAREKVVESLGRADPMPMTWLGAEEFVFLLPGGTDDEATEQRAAALARTVAAELRQPCSAGMAHGRTGELAEALETARRISGVAPPANVRQQLYTVDDLFVEVGVAAAPWLDDWLRGYIMRLRPGPDLLLTLDVYFRNDMSRLGTASALHIHPRTLDYRLQRVRELTGLVPGSTRGVRILSAAVTRALGAGWC